jgi:hypothetical protein
MEAAINFAHYLLYLEIVVAITIIFDWHCPNRGIGQFIQSLCTGGIDRRTIIPEGRHDVIDKQCYDCSTVIPKNKKMHHKAKMFSFISDKGGVLYLMSFFS